jgi:hypothetical protein
LRLRGPQDGKKLRVIEHGTLPRTAAARAWDGIDGSATQRPECSGHPPAGRSPIAFGPRGRTRELLFGRRPDGARRWWWTWKGRAGMASETALRLSGGGHETPAGIEPPDLRAKARRSPENRSRPARTAERLGG